MLDIKGSADYLSRSTGSFSNFSMLFAGKGHTFLIVDLCGLFQNIREDLSVLSRKIRNMIIITFYVIFQIVMPNSFHEISFYSHSHYLYPIIHLRMMKMKWKFRISKK